RGERSASRSIAASAVSRRCTAPKARRCAWARSRPASPRRSASSRKKRSVWASRSKVARIASKASARAGVTLTIVPAPLPARRTGYARLVAPRSQCGHSMPAKVGVRRHRLAAWRLHDLQPQRAAAAAEQKRTPLSLHLALLDADVDRACTSHPEPVLVANLEVGADVGRQGANCAGELTGRAGGVE